MTTLLNADTSFSGNTFGISDLISLKSSVFNGNTHYSFDVLLNDQTNFFTVNLTVFIVLKSISNVDSTVNYFVPQQILDNLLKNEQIYIPRIYIKQNSLPPKTQSVFPNFENNSFQDYYRILNTLHLLDPFLTSGKSMNIHLNLSPQTFLQTTKE